MPSFLGYVDKFGKLPKYLTFSIAALMSFYTSQTEVEFNGGICLQGDRNGEKYNIRDDKFVLDFFKENSSKSPAEFTHAYLSNTKFFGGNDLSKVAGLEDAITAYITDIRERGMRAVVTDVVNK
jgi:tagaturonate reductase